MRSAATAAPVPLGDNTAVPTGNRLHSTSSGATPPRAIAPAASGLAKILLRPSVHTARMSDSGHLPSESDGTASGLPRIQDFVARNVTFPAYCRTTSFDRATRDFQGEIRRIEELCGMFSPDDFVRRVTIPPMLGLEDDERDWSAAMVVEHVVLVGEAIGGTLVFLSRGQTPPAAFDRKAMRPRGAKGVETVTALRALARDYPRLVQTELGTATGGIHPHPIFGDLDLHRWHCLSVAHLRVHRRQLHEIRRRITAGAKTGGFLGVLLPEATPDLDPQT